MRKHRACIQGLISFGLFGVLFGCGSQSDLMLPKPTAGQPSDRTNLPTHTGTAVVSTEGAVISAGAAEVVIPRGALASPVEIVVQAADPASFAEIPNAEEEQVLAFLPHGTQFLKPVTIHIPHDHVSVDGLSLFTSEPDQPWSNVAGATFTDEYAVADVTHFSFFFASPTPVEEIVLPVDSNGGAGGSNSTAGSGGSDAVANAGAGGEPASGGAAGEGGEGGAAGDTSAAGSAGEGGEAGTSNTSDPDAGPGLGGAGGSTAGEGGGAGTTATPRPDAGVAGGGSGEGGEGGYAGSSAGAGGGAGSPSTGGSGGATSGGDDFDYLDNGVWHGYMYEGADPASDITRTGSCVEGEVAAGSSSYALWGWNVNQDEFGGLSSWDPNAETLRYDIDARSDEPLVLQLIDDQDVMYCLALEEGFYFGEAQLADFSTDCWGTGDGTLYNGAPIVRTQVLVPSQVEAVQPFDFCVYDIRPQVGYVDPGGGPDAGAGGSSGAGTGGGTSTGGSGGASTGMGGSSAGGSAGTSGGPDDNYADNGVWRGYMYEGADPASDITRTGSCVEGTVAAGSSSFALWGWNVNQDEFGSLSSWDPNAETLRYDIDARSDEPLVLQLIDDQDVMYCLALEEGFYFGEAQLADFSTDCWGTGDGTLYNGAPIVRTQVLVPSQVEAAQPFDFCVYDIRPQVGYVDPGGGPDAGAGGSSGAGTGGGTSTGGSGGASTGMGGSSAGGSAGTSGGPDDNYADNGVWHGYMYEGADPASEIARTGSCVEGTVAAGSSSYALWGWNVNQEESGSLSSWDPNAETLRYDIDARSDEPLVLQLIDDQNVTYCLALEEGFYFGEAELADFSTDCWGTGDGTLYNGAPIERTQVLVPSQAEQAQPFDFCVYDIRPLVGYVDPGGGPDAGAGGSAGAGTGGGASTGGSGGASTGMGGSSAGGSAGTSGGPDDNYADNGVWHGYMYEFADPASDITRTGSCVAGELGAGPSSVALWGWNVNQDESGSLSSWDPNAESLRYEVDSLFGERLVLQLIDDQQETYCLAVEEGSYFGEAQLADFSTDCWGSGDGTFYSGAPIERTQVLVSNPTEQAQPFDFCVYDIRPLVGYVDPGGGPDAGAGGSAGAGTGGGASTGGASGGPGDPGGDVDYRDNGVWHGHLYSAAEDETSYVLRDDMCAYGEVGMGVTNYALWGWHINQDPFSEIGSWQPTSDGIRYNIETSFEEPLRLQLRVNSQNFCRVLAQESGVALFSEFNTQCWDGLGEGYDGVTPISSVDVLVPSNPITAQPFGMCVYDLSPFTEGDGAGPDAGTGYAGSGAGGSTGGSDGYPVEPGDGDPETGGAAGAGGATGGQDAGVPD